MELNAIPNTIKVIEKLRWNAHLNKHIHFNASKRDRSYHIWVGVPIVVISVLLSFLLAVSGADNMIIQFGTVKSSGQFVNSEATGSKNKISRNSKIPNKIDLPIWAELVGALLALFAAGLSAIQTFFNFQKEYEGHRQLGNEYLAIARECDRLIALYFDNLITLKDLAEKLELLNTKYIDTNSRTETLNVNDKDYIRAKKFQEQKDNEEPSLVQLKCGQEACLPNNLKD